MTNLETRISKNRMQQIYHELKAYETQRTKERIGTAKKCLVVGFIMGLALGWILRGFI